MHEIGLCEPVLDAVQRRAAGRRVTGVKLRVGAAHRVVPAAMQQAFELVSAGTVAEGAALELLAVEGDELTLESISVAHPGEVAADVPGDPG
ncbi:MAG: hydrogenase maturation nickel metallochaperone HypA [Micromonosporaceae bacterium]